jgi:hypothetical protein
MNPTSLALIDIEAEAEAAASLPVPANTVVGAGLVLGVHAAQPPATVDEPTRSALDTILGEGQSISEQELAALRRAASVLRRPCDPESFVWRAVQGPTDIDRLMRAVVVYHRFNVQAVRISERIGANDEFRRFVRQAATDGGTTLAEALEQERRHVDRIASFMETLRGFMEKAEAVFGGRDWTIGAVLALAASAPGMIHSRQVLEHGWDLPHMPSDLCLDEVEGIRIDLTYIAGEVREAYGWNMLSYSLNALAGVRRALFDGGGDFRTALAGFGIEEEDDDRLIELAGNVRAFIEACGRLERVLEENGYGERHMPSVVSIVLLRKYLMAAAEAGGLEWRDVCEALTPRAAVDGAAVVALVTTLESDNFSAKLASISRDRGQYIENVILAAEHYVFSRQYWIDAGERVVVCDPDIRMMDLRAILEMEPEIKGNTEILSRAGAMDREDIVTLEDHLEWLVGVYALPVSNRAIARIVESRGAILGDLTRLS